MSRHSRHPFPLLAGLLAALSFSTAGTASAQTPPDERIRAVESVLRCAPEQQGAVLALFRDHEPLLAFLPLNELRAVRVLKDGLLELRFDFGRRSTRKVTLPRTERFVVDADREGLPAAKAKAVRVRSEERTLIVHRSVRMKYDERGFTGVRSGDLELAYGLLSPDIELRTEMQPGKVATDEDGRVVVEMDGEGRPVRRNGAYVPVRADRWLILEVCGRRVEVPLPDGRDAS